jgi:DtxR family Mn-dependent transcriptional regulator
METLSSTEENYLKAIFKICEGEEKVATTNAIAAEMNTTAASVTDMLKRLSGKALINYESRKGVTLTEEGNKVATTLVRKHRLWEVFLVKTLHFSWDEVHEIAEQLEHIQSPELINRLDQLLGEPKFDPHGDPIPDAEGNFTFRRQTPLSEMLEGDEGVVVGVLEHSSTFLQYLDRMELGLGARVKLIEKFEFDASVRIILNAKTETIISNKVSSNLLVQKSR